jgi:hypothetical protein
MTALVVKFSAQSVGEGGGVKQRRKERQKGKGADDEIFSQGEIEDIQVYDADDKKDESDMDDAPSDEDVAPEPIAL